LDGLVGRFRGVFENLVRLELLKCFFFFLSMALSQRQLSMSNVFVCCLWQVLIGFRGQIDVTSQRIGWFARPHRLPRRNRRREVWLQTFFSTTVLTLTMDMRRFNARFVSILKSVSLFSCAVHFRVEASKWSCFSLKTFQNHSVFFDWPIRNMQSFYSQLQLRF
jgi:hypothetical protein